jgi:hypothetical protein
LEIRATKPSSGQTIEIAHIDPGDGPLFAFDASSDLVIIMPGGVDMIGHAAIFGDTKVAYDVLPLDDADQRVMWWRYRSRPDDPGNRRWYCDTVVPQLHENVRSVGLGKCSR